MRTSMCFEVFLVDYFNVQTHNIQEVDVITKREIQIEHICSLESHDISKRRPNVEKI